MKREFNTQTVGVRAIDVGYFQTKFTLGRQRGGGNGGPIITDFFPSIAPKVEPARPVVTGPMSAPLKGRPIRIGDIDYFVGRDLRFYASSTAPRSIGENFSESATYKALTYGALDQMAAKSGSFGLEIEHLVVGLPCNTISKYGPGLKRWLERSRRCSRTVAPPHRIASLGSGRRSGARAGAYTPATFAGAATRSWNSFELNHRHTASSSLAALAGPHSSLMRSSGVSAAGL